MIQDRLTALLNAYYSSCVPFTAANPNSFIRQICVTMFLHHAKIQEIICLSFIVNIVYIIYILKYSFKVNYLTVELSESVGSNSRGLPRLESFIDI